MSYNASEQEVVSVSSLPSNERVRYFLAKVADWEEVWSLADEDGWALYSSDSHRQLVPVWPASAFAKVCCVGIWKDYCPQAIQMVDWLSKWTPGMLRDGRSVAVFPTEFDLGVEMDPQVLASNLGDALDDYE